jgi:hypothetical protein
MHSQANSQSSSPPTSTRPTGLLVELASGIDALYLTGRAELPPPLVEALEAARSSAGEERAVVPFCEWRGVEFGIAPGGLNMHRYRLVSTAGIIGVTASEHLPSLMIQARAEFLHAVGPSTALRFFEGFGEFLASGRVVWKLSRLDLFCDVQGWDFSSADRERFVCRPKARSLFELDSAMTGIVLGQRASGTVMARIYDKTHQIDRKGIDWVHDLWGTRFDPARPVWRIEFEIGRKGLVEYGIDTPTDGLDRADVLWASVTENWLRYCTPTADDTRSRWPTSPEWAAIQHVRLRGTALGVARVRAGARRGSLRKLTPGLVGYLVSAAALTDATDLDTTFASVRSIIAADERRRSVLFSHRIERRVAEGRFG